MQNSRVICSAVVAVSVVFSSGATSAADLPARIYSKAPIAPAADQIWTGLYVGASLGGKEANADWTTTSFANPFAPPGAFVVDASSPATYRPSAGRFGGFAGYDRQIDPRWIVGLEIDAAYSDRAATSAGIPGCIVACIGTPGPSADAASVKMGWDASARGRLGYLVSPNLLIYGTGGIAWQSIRDSATCQNGLTDAVCPGLPGSPFSTVTNTTVRTGWTVGGGVDARVTGNWMLRGEYRYSDFGTWNNSFALGPAPFTTTVATQLKINTQIGLVGVIYKFGEPVVARY